MAWLALGGCGLVGLCSHAGTTSALLVLWAGWPWHNFCSAGTAALGGLEFGAYNHLSLRLNGFSNVISPTL